ncbi:MAG: hypothetical protein APR53_06830 [Methanoculleus sp. SDB]|nr:MAG: hypothetical protein APR53_06830 [Methanoculleus sp. SDB]
MSLRDDILTILQQDLGPAAPIFLEKCCKKRLGRTSHEIVPGDISVLAECFYQGVAESIGVPNAERVRGHVLAMRQ